MDIQNVKTYILNMLVYKNNIHHQYVLNGIMVFFDSLHNVITLINIHHLYNNNHTLCS